MHFKNNIKQRNVTIQGLRSFKDTLPKNIKKIINKKGHIYSETINNWKYIVGTELFKFCYPKTFKNSNRFGVSTLVVMVQRGHEIDLEYSKKNVLDKMNSFFGYSVVEKLKLISFDDEEKFLSKNLISNKNVTINKYQDKVKNVKNKKIKKSLMELAKVFKKR
ncbi:MAG: DUF721 domain-containing protein [Pelagibacteraceae bacterium]|nr:DUF721 domain-containing protein [Pelagibacteraceae bacterium]PHX89004.1 MAG: hypothetical protein CK535_03705 [Pelagibacteraceae bacterium]